MEETLKIKVEFTGGAELLFDNQKMIELELTQTTGEGWTIKSLIKHLAEKHIRERVELFTIGGKIRPGILIMVNDIDYELVGGESYKLKSGDSIFFISSLHGG